LPDLRVFGGVFRVFKYKILSSSNKDNITSSSPINIPFISFSCLIALAKNLSSITSSSPIYIPFISFSCLIALAKNLSSILNKSGESGHFYLIPDFRGNGFNISLFSMLVLDLLYMAFITLRYVPSSPSSLGLLS
jgi:hypothetical protein